MKKIFFILFAFFILVSCGNKSNNVVSKKIMSEETYGTTMYAIEHNFNKEQVDSMCIVDDLLKIEEWTTAYFFDFETNGKIEKRIFNKFDKKNSVLYIALINEDEYLITKRIVTKE